jgi:hypothetical protein
VLPTLLAPFLPLTLLTGSAPAPGVHASERDRYHRVESASKPSQQARETDIGAGLVTRTLFASTRPPEATRPRQPEPGSAREGSAQGSNLSDVALSKLTSEGDVSVRDLRRSITWSPQWGVLSRLNSYRSMHTRDPSRTHVMLQLELIPPRTVGPWSIVEAQLRQHASAARPLRVSQEPVGPDGVLRALLETEVDAREFSSPYQLRLKLGEGSATETLVLENITFP